MNQFCSAPSSRRQFPGNFNFLSAIAIVCFLALSPVRAEDPESQYLHIFDLIQQGDLLKKNGHPDQALAKYREAQIDLAKFQRTYPDKNAKVISYRANYVASQIAAIAPEGSATTSTNQPGAAGKSGSTSTGSAQVKLLEPGAEPRKVLRFSPKPGDKQSMLMTMKIGMAIRTGDAPEQPLKLPTMKLVMDVTITNVTPDGDINYEIVTSDASVESDPDVIAQVAEAMKNAVAGMKGIGGKGTISSRGVSKGAEIKAPEGADPQVTQFVEQMKETMARVATPLPEEAVGAGAKWEVKTPVKSQGINLNQTEDFQLASMDDERAAVKTSFTQTASNQKISNPMMPGSKVDLTKMTGKGTGEVSLAFAQILPSEASAELNQEMAMSMTVGGQKQTMGMKMDLNLHIESK
jgi:hypothetical protein